VLDALIGLFTGIPWMSGISTHLTWQRSANHHPNNWYYPKVCGIIKEVLNGCSFGKLVECSI
jgi:hypothetical protein